MARAKKAEKKPKAYNWDTRVMSALRRVWRYSPERLNAISAARDPHEKKLVHCSVCKKWVNVKLAQVDHVEPVVPLTGFDTWDAVISRMKSTNLQVLCEECHKALTKEQNATRRLNKPKKASKPKPKKGSFL